MNVIIDMMNVKIVWDNVWVEWYWNDGVIYYIGDGNIMGLGN